MKTIGIIPARFASSRFPGKPLVDINGKSMIQRVYEQCLKSQKLDEVWIATDDEKIFNHVVGFGGKVTMTSVSHNSGTDRCAEAAFSMPEDSIIINIQGDEPFIDPLQIDNLIDCFQLNTTQIATLVMKVKSQEELDNTNTPKVVLSQSGKALYFSRNTIPFLRGKDKKDWLSHQTFYKHIGIYGFRKSILMELTQLPESALEVSEGLEQLRWLENGYTIQTALTEIETHAVDVPEDLEKLKKFY